MTSYREVQAKHRQEGKQFPVEFAFNREQFQQGLQRLSISESEAVSIGGGGFVRKTDLPAFKEMIMRHANEHKRAMASPDYLYSMFLYELANHEYCITGRYSDALEACGLTLSEIKQNPAMSEALIKAEEEYLSNVGNY